MLIVIFANDMMCRYYLQTGSGTVDVNGAGCLDCSELVANLKDIKVTFARGGSEAGGVVRKATSQLSLIGAAREAVLSEYRRNYLQAKAAFAVYVADDRWVYHEAFSCPLDFASLEFDSYTAKINCIDNSAEALLKANKGTSYEYAVSNLKEGVAFGYDRVLVANDWEWEVMADSMDGTPVTEKVFGTETYSVGRDSGPVTGRAWFPYIGNIEGHVPRNTTIEVLDQEESVHRTRFWSMDKNAFGDIAWTSPDAGFARALKACDVRVDLTGLSAGFTEWASDGETLPRVAFGLKYHLCIKRAGEAKAVELPVETVARLMVTPVPGGGMVNALPYSYTTPFKGTVHLLAGDLLQLYLEVDTITGMKQAAVAVAKPGIVMDWNERGDTVAVDVVTPLALLNRLLKTIGGTKMALTGAIEETVGGVANERLKWTRLVAAESLRGMPNAKMKTSFSDFCAFMSAEYGYVYGVEENAGRTSAVVRFRHRSEVYRAEVVKVVEPVAEPSYKVDSSGIYSNVQAGYTRQDYDSGNTGYDEFNFSCSYTTGVTLKDKKLELMCPYRADCYGMEEAVNKGQEASSPATSGQDDTGEEATSSDNDVFLVRVAPELKGGMYAPDRSVAVTGVFSATVFNAELSPPYMVAANEAYIGTYCDRLTYVSSTGNSSAVIGGVPLKKDIDIARRLMRAAGISIKTNDFGLPSTWDGLVAFEWEGREYRGYLDSLDVKFEAPEALEYQLLEAGDGLAGLPPAGADEAGKRITD